MVYKNLIYKNTDDTVYIKHTRICLPVQEMKETWVQSLGQEDPLEKEMVYTPIFLAWEIPWTEEPGGLQSMGSQNIRAQLGN